MNDAMVIGTYYNNVRGIIILRAGAGAEESGTSELFREMSFSHFVVFRDECP